VHCKTGSNSLSTSPKKTDGQKGIELQSLEIIANAAQEVGRAEAG
jgi:hypothetical protein